jgi:hypothetical protein
MSEPYIISPSTQRWIDKLGVKVSIVGDRFVARDPNRKRSKYEGGNLEYLLTQIEMDREEAEKKTITKKLNGAENPKPAASAPEKAEEVKITADSLKDTTASVPENKPTETEPQSVPKKARGKHVKRATSDWKTYAVGKLILTNPDKTPDEIFAMCKENGIETKETTIVGLSRYFKLCLLIISDLKEEK